MKSMILRHLSGESMGRFPVWMMRQAGRYLPEYRKIREGHSFWEMVTTPELAARVSLLPLDVLPVDGVIFFSDILTLPYGLGIEVKMQESVGPVVTKPLRSASEFHVFQGFDPKKHTGFVGPALSQIRKTLSPEIALLGFAGAPWTVGCYLVEGKASRQFEHILSWALSEEKSCGAALRDLMDATYRYLVWQFENGAQLVQLFDTWLNLMPRPFFLNVYRPILIELFQRLSDRGVPAIYFSKNAHHLLEDFVGIPAKGLSVDGLLPLPEVERRTQGKFFLQGNLDPVLLLQSSEGVVRLKTRQLVNEARMLKNPPILNLGHGILPGTPLENAKAFVAEARTLWT